MKKIILLIFLIHFNIIFGFASGYAWAQDRAVKVKQNVNTEGIFQFSIPSTFLKITGNRLKELKSQMIESGKELAESSRSANSKDFTEKDLPFFSAYEPPDRKVTIVFLGQQNSVISDREEMFRANEERIEWGKNSGRLSKNSKGVSRLTIDGFPSLLMDISFKDGERLQTFTVFVSSFPKSLFGVTIQFKAGSYELYRESIAFLVDSLKIALPKK